VVLVRQPHLPQRRRHFLRHRAGCFPPGVSVSLCLRSAT
jgi:hypothetical protein